MERWVQAGKTGSKGQARGSTLENKVVTSPAPKSGIRDNHSRGSIGDFLRERIRAEADLAFVSAYFTIYAYEALKGEVVAEALGKAERRNYQELFLAHAMQQGQRRADVRGAEFP